MDDILLIQSIERYLANEMQPAEKAYFEELRKNTPEIDQMVVEHTMFLHQMDNFSSRTSFKHSLNEVHIKLLSIGDINEGQQQTIKTKVVSIFNKYKKVTAIAAAVGGGIALFTSMLVSSYKDVSPTVERLSKKQLQQDQQIAALNKELSKSKIPSKAEVLNGGSSFLIDGNGYLITNAHVLEGATLASVYNEDGKEYNAVIAYKNDEKDLAILKINDEEFEPIKNLPYSIKKTNIDLGEEVYTIGFPNFPRTDVVYNIGYLSSIKGYNGDTASCQIQMNANHGNSGGPIFNKRGEVVGVLSTKLSKADGVSFAIKSKNIYQIVEDLKTTDSTANSLKIASSTTLNGEDRVGQIKKIEHFVYMVKAYKK
jgi:serine protease Do